MTTVTEHPPILEHDDGELGYVRYDLAPTFRHAVRVLNESAGMDIDVDWLDGGVVEMRPAPKDGCPEWYAEAPTGEGVARYWKLTI